MRLCAATTMLAMCLVLFGGRALGQAGGAGVAKADANPALATIAESLGTIENRDLLRVRIDGLRPPPAPAEKWVRVDDDGAASLPYLGSRKVAGLSTAQAEGAIAKAYKEAGVIAHAQVDVRRIEVGSRVKDANVGKLAKGDLVAVSVDDLTGPGVTAEFRSHVTTDGELAVPLLGALKLDGMTEGQAEQLVAKEYEKRGMIRNAVVGVRVVEPAGRSKVTPGPIGKGDLLGITICDFTGPGVRSEFNARVGADGSIGFPYVGTIPVEGLTEARAAEAIAKALRERHLSAMPILSLYRVQSADRADVKLGPVAPGEVLRVSITGLAGPGVETIKTVRVDDHGHIAMPLTGGIKVAGLTEAAAAVAIANTYRDRNLIAQAQVTVLKINGAAPLPEEELEPLAPPAPSKDPARQARARRQ